MSVPRQVQELQLGRLPSQIQIHPASHLRLVHLLAAPSAEVGPSLEPDSVPHPLGIVWHLRRIKGWAFRLQGTLPQLGMTMKPANYQNFKGERNLTGISEAVGISVQKGMSMNTVSSGIRSPESRNHTGFSEAWLTQTPPPEPSIQGRTPFLP